MADVFVARGSHSCSYVGLGETEELSAIDRFEKYFEGDDVVLLGAEKSHDDLWIVLYRYEWDDPEDRWEFHCCVSKQTVRTAK